jgi:hypothetical protein
MLTSSQPMMTPSVKVSSDPVIPEMVLAADKATIALAASNANGRPALTPATSRDGAPDRLRSR